MAELHIDIIDGNGGKKDIRNGWEFDRVAIVTGVEGDVATRLILASEADGMPQLGDPHPALNTCTLRDISPESIDTDTIKLRLHYSEYVEITGGTPDAPIQGMPCPIQVGTSVQQESTNRDFQGNDIYVTVAFPADFPDDPPMAGQTVQPVVEVPKLFPDTTISITYTEFENPMYKSNWYVGTTNIGGWSLHPAAYPDTWLCVGIVGTSPSVDVPYQVTYSFVYKEDGWNPKISYKRRDTGTVPEFAEEGLGKNVSVRLYWQTDFNDLNL